MAKKETYGNCPCPLHYHHKKGFLGWFLIIVGILYILRDLGWISPTFPLWQTLLILWGIKMVWVSSKK